MARNGYEQRKEWGHIQIRLTIPAIDREELQAVYGKIPNAEIARLIRRLCDHHRAARGAARLGDLTKWSETTEDLKYHQ